MDERPQLTDEDRELICEALKFAETATVFHARLKHGDPEEVRARYRAVIAKVQPTDADSEVVDAEG